MTRKPTSSTPRAARSTRRARPAAKRKARRPAVRPPSPGEGKRGEDGYLAYLLRQAQAAVRLSLDRALTSTGLTHPQFVVLTMLK
ncbi:MAG: MarR family transcriptional regulator, partial [Bradyrhizobium sp.]